MAHYIINSLEEGEQIVFQGRLHWISIYQYLLFGFILILVAGSLVAFGYFLSHSKLFIIGVGVFVLAVVILIIGRIIRTRSEFAVTTSRFIQKDGILNIKMTEIPLFKIETVNFYQSLWQRMVGTGSIELVGSGGTFHRVEYIEKPLMVRKTIVSTINKNPNKD